MDKQGRVFFSPELRRELGVEDQPVQVYAYAGQIEVLNGAAYEERKTAAMATAGPDRATMKARSEVMPYACSGDAGRVARTAGRETGRRVPGLHRGSGRSHAADRGAVDHRDL